MFNRYFKTNTNRRRRRAFNKNSSLVIKIIVLSSVFSLTLGTCKHSRKAPRTDWGLCTLWLRAAFIVRLHWSSDTKWSFSKAHYYFIHSVVLLLLIGDIPGGKGSQRTIARDAREWARFYPVLLISFCSSHQHMARGWWCCWALNDTELTTTPGMTGG